MAFFEQFFVTLVVFFSLEALLGSLAPPLQQKSHLQSQIHELICPARLVQRYF